MIREHQPEDVEESDAELRKSVEQMGFLLQLEYNLIAGYTCRLRNGFHSD